ncbi:MAG: LOG family protein [Acidobacteriota bacterium]
MNVAVFGSSLPREGEPAYEVARELGREVARRRAAVLCGGYGGVMEAACRGAAEAGGESVGVLLAGRGEPNRWASRMLVETDLSRRLARLRDLAGAWIFLPRGLGTMLELVWISESLVKGLVAPRPVVLLGDFWRPTLEKALAEASSSEGAKTLRQCIREADSPAEAVGAALRGVPAASAP